MILSIRKNESDKLRDSWLNLDDIFEEVLGPKGVASLETGNPIA